MSNSTSSDLFDFLAWKSSPIPPPIQKGAHNLVQTKQQFQIAEKIYSAHIQKSKKKQNDMLIKMTSMGTNQDKVNALTMLIQQSPTTCLEFLGKFVELIEHSMKTSVDNVSKPLKDVFCDFLLPDRPMVSFYERQLQDQELAAAYFEDQVKAYFLRFLKAIESSLLTSTIERNKTQMLKLLYDIFSNKPHETSLIVTIFVNKLGDSQKKVASEALFCLMQIAKTNTKSKQFQTLKELVREIDAFLMRRNLTEKAKYYGMLFLNHIVFDNSNQMREVATLVMKVYFTFFERLVQADAVESKNLDSMLTGIHRAFPFSNLQKSEFEKYLDPLWKLAEFFPEFKKSFLALQVLEKIIEFNHDIRNRFFRVLYQRLAKSDWLFSNINYQNLFVDLVFRVLQIDTDNVRASAILKRTLGMGLYLSPPLASQILIRASMLFKQNPKLFELVSTAENQLGKSTWKSTSLGGEVAKGKESSKDKKKQSKNEKSQQVAQKGDVTFNEFHNDPRHANAHTTGLWSLTLHSAQYHPSVSHFAQQILAKQNPIAYDGDPIEDFSAKNFLDKFVAKKPKAVARSESVEEVQKEFSKKPRAGRHLMSKEQIDKLVEDTTLQSVSVSDYLNKQNPALKDETFFYEYYQTLKRLDTKNKPKGALEEPEKEEQEEVAKLTKKSSSKKYDYSQLSNQDFEENLNAFSDEDSEVLYSPSESDSDEEDQDNQENAGDELGDIFEKIAEGPGEKMKKWLKKNDAPAKRKGPNQFAKNKKFKNEKMPTKKRFSKSPKKR